MNKDYNEIEYSNFTKNVQSLYKFEQFGFSTLLATKGTSSFNTPELINKITSFQFEGVMNSLYGSNKVDYSYRKFSTNDKRFKSTGVNVKSTISVLEKYYFSKGLIGSNITTSDYNLEMIKTVLTSVPKETNMIANFFNLFYIKIRESRQSFELFGCIKTVDFFKNYIDRVYLINNYDEALYIFNVNDISKDLINFEYKKFFNNFDSGTTITVDNIFKLYLKIYQEELLKSKTEGFVIFAESGSGEYEKKEISRMEQLDRLGITYNIVNFEATQKLQFLFDINGDNSILNPVTNVLNEVYTRYYTLANDLKPGSPKCELLKTVLYAGVYLLKDSDDSSNLTANKSVFNKMKEITDADVNWATGTDKTDDASFYGDSDFAKMFFTYYSYMVRDYNPFSDVVDNATCNKMDMNAMDIHSMFASDEISKVLQDILYNKSLAGDKSLYELIYMSRDLLKLIGEPIIVSSAISEMINFVSGIVSSIINNIVNELDFAFTDTMTELFYKDIFPWFDGKKISLAGIHNSVAILIVILEQCNPDGNGKIQSISEEDFINKALSVLGIEEDALEYCGYFAFTGELNPNETSSYSKIMDKDKLFKDIKNDRYTCKRNEKVAYSMIKFAESKHMYLNSNEFTTTERNYSNKHYVSRLVNSLTKEEFYYILDLYSVNRIPIEKYFTDFSDKELHDFNFNVLKTDITMRFNHDSPSFYKTFTEQNKESIRMEMKETKFNMNLYKKWIEIGIEEYLDASDFNENRFEEAMLENSRLGDIDDFLMRFLPSIMTLSKVFGSNFDSIKTVISFLESVNKFIAQDLFWNLFIGVKDKLLKIARSYTDKMFETINSLSSKLPSKTIIDLNLDTRDAVAELDKLLEVMSDLTQLTNLVSNCYNNDDNNIYSRNEKKKNDITIISKEDKERKEDEGVIFVDNNKKTDEKFDYEIIYYDKEQIIAVDKNGNQKVIVDKDDSYDPNTEVINKKTTPDSDKSDANKTPDGQVPINNKPKPGYDPNVPIIIDNTYIELIKIRDIVTNISNKEVVYIINEIKEKEYELEKEKKKNRPNNKVVIQINDDITKLTEDLNNVKNKYNIITSDVSDVPETKKEEEPVILFDFKTGNYTFEERVKQINELNDTALDNNIPLTNSDIFYLLS